VSTIQKTPGGEISEILQGAQSYRFQVERHKILINDTETKSFTTAITFSVQLQMQPFIPNLTLRHTGSDTKALSSGSKNLHSSLHYLERI